MISPPNIFLGNLMSALCHPNFHTTNTQVGRIKVNERHFYEVVGIAGLLNPLPQTKSRKGRLDSLFSIDSAIF